ncbi:hypothetical protein [Enterobacter bugandensis]
MKSTFFSIGALSIAVLASSCQSIAVDEIAAGNRASYQRACHYLLRRAGMLIVVLILSGCVSPDQQRAIDLQNDAKKCAATGFKPGSEAMARCMSTAAQMRANDEEREVWIQQQQNNEWNRQHREQEKATDAWFNSSLGASLSSSKEASTPIDSTPHFDKNGEPNFDVQGNYQGCHDVGCLVDDPDNDN